LRRSAVCCCHALLLARDNRDSAREKCPHGDFRRIAENSQVPPALVGTVVNGLHHVKDVARQVLLDRHWWVK
jgi:hypothetical protein